MHIEQYYKEDRFENGFMIYATDTREFPWIYLHGDSLGGPEVRAKTADSMVVRTPSLCPNAPARVLRRALPRIVGGDVLQVYPSARLAYMAAGLLLQPSKTHIGRRR